MKNWTFIYLLAIILGITACEEDDLTPSMADEDRLPELLDLSKPLVKEFKEKYDVNILYSYDDTLDFKFGMTPSGTTSQWGNIKIIHLDSMEVVDYALEKLDEMVLTYMNDDFRKILPHKILLADIVSSLSAAPQIPLLESLIIQKRELIRLLAILSQLICLLSIKSLWSGIVKQTG